MLLSIILPSYNVGQYLESCVGSIFNSGLSTEIYEIIIIDDGSTDGTGEIAEGLSVKYSNVYYFSQKNQGVSAARNLGLIKALNKYVWFIDPDDMVKSEVVLDLLYMAVDNDLDALGMNFYGITEDGSLLPKEKGKLARGSIDFISGGEFYKLNYKRSYIWQYIIKREVFLSHDIKFKEGMVMEDSEILPRILAHIYRIGIFKEPVYAYRRRSDSLLRSKNPKTELVFIESAILLAESINEQIEQFSSYKGLAEGLAKKSIQVNQILFLKFIAGDWSKEQLKQFVSAMKQKRVFPFKKICNLSPLMNLRLNTWRQMVNLYPIYVSRLYKKVNRESK